MKKLLEVKRVTSGYVKEVILRDISFCVEEGDFLGIIGPNGSGKSTLLRTISRILKPFDGEILFDGEDIYRLPLKEVAKRMAMVPQETAFTFSFSVLDFVLLGRSPYLGRFQQETKMDFEIARESLVCTDSLGLIDREIDVLSAGERQRVIIAKALAQQPRLLLLDEPTSHLDIGYQIEMLDLVKRLNREKNLTVLLVLHDLNLASEYCNRLILIDRGRIHTAGIPKEVLNYRTIEEVYNTVVVVNENPLSSKPHVLLVPGKSYN